MGLEDLERYLSAIGAVFEKRQEMLLLKEHKGLLFRVRFTEEKHGWVQGRLLIPVGTRKIDDIDGLVFEMETRLGPYVEVGFLHDEHAFFVGRTIWDGNDFEEEIGGFQRLSRYVSPLFLNVEEQGEWSNDLINLAFYPPGYFSRA